MHGPARRWILGLGFLAAGVACTLGRRRLHRGAPTARPPRPALRLADALLLVILVGCSSGARANGGATAAAGGARASDAASDTGSGVAGATGLGAEADAVWAELVAAWDEAGAYRSGEVETTTLDAARRRVDGLLARLADLDRVRTDAPGLVALLRAEFQARLEVRPAEVPCDEPRTPRRPEAEAWERLAVRVEALEALASKGYVNGWLREHVLERLRQDAAAVRAGVEAGDAWRTEDERMRRCDPAEALGVLERAEAALRVLVGP